MERVTNRQPAHGFAVRTKYTMNLRSAILIVLFI